jgi:hypothetical protein
MAWTDNSENIKDLQYSKQGFTTEKEVADLIQERFSDVSKFYEMEVAEVVDVILSKDELPDVFDEDYQPEWDELDYSYIGYIKARMINSEAGKASPDLKWLRPLDTNIKEYPLKGEYVVVVSHFHRQFGSKHQPGVRFYSQKINLLHSVNNNAMNGIGSIGDRDFDPDYVIGDVFQINSDIRQVQPYEGDIIFNGRFGQSIRFGGGDSFLQSPNIKIRAGQLTDAGIFDVEDQNVDFEEIPLKPVVEDINADGSSVWLTVDGEFPIPLIHADGFVGPNDLEGKSIIVNSDKIIINAKAGQIYQSASTEIKLSAPKIMLGDTSKSDGAIPHGTLLLAALENLISIVSTLGTTPCANAVPLMPAIDAQLSGVLDTLEKAMDTVGHISLNED